MSKKLAITLALSLGLGAAAAPTIHRRLRVPGASVPAIPVAVAQSKSGERIVSDGIALEFSAEVVSPDSSRRAGTLREGDDVLFRFRIADTATGAPIVGAYPAAWMDRADLAPADGKKPKNCLKRAQSLLGGGYFAQAELDLNIYHVLTLNEDASLSVVDPRFGFGGTKLLAMVALKGPGEDWALASDQSRLFVSIPACGRVSVISPASWTEIGGVDVSPTPTRLAFQPDEQYLWVATGEVDEGKESGVAVIRPDTLEVVKSIATGRGRHEIAFDENSRFAFVSNTSSGTVSVIDVRGLSKVDDLAVGRRPSSMAYSSRARRLYVNDLEGGRVAVIDADAPRVVARLDLGLGIAQVRFAPDGRHGFFLAPSRRAVLILDAATNQVIQTAVVEPDPDQIAFSNQLAYILHATSSTVLMIPLSQVGDDGRRAGLADFPGGQNAPGAVSRLSRADAIARAPGMNAVLLANPADKAVYFYKEGMAAPMGSFTNYDRTPRAVRVIDRSLRERSAPGTYETIARLPRSGRYDVVFFLDTPRIVHCFPMTVEADLDRSRGRAADAVRVAYLNGPRAAGPGERICLDIELTRAGRPIPRDDLTDVTATAMLAPGIWHDRPAPKAIGDGLCRVEFVPPREGMYYVYPGSVRLGLDARWSVPFIFEVKEGSK